MQTSCVNISHLQNRIWKWIEMNVVLLFDRYIVDCYDICWQKGLECNSLDPIIAKMLQRDLKNGFLVNRNKRYFYLRFPRIQIFRKPILQYAVPNRLSQNWKSRIATVSACSTLHWMCVNSYTYIYINRCNKQQVASSNKVVYS